MREGIIATPSLALQNVPVVSASADEETTLRIVLHVVRIGILHLVDGILGLSRGQSMIYKCQAYTLRASGMTR